MLRLIRQESRNERISYGEKDRMRLKRCPLERSLPSRVFRFLGYSKADIEQRRDILSYDRRVTRRIMGDKKTDANGCVKRANSDQIAKRPVRKSVGSRSLSLRCYLSKGEFVQGDVKNRAAWLRIV